MHYSVSTRICWVGIKSFYLMEETDGFHNTRKGYMEWLRWASVSQWKISMEFRKKKPYVVLHPKYCVHIWKEKVKPTLTLYL